jgi:hypothetical protein
MAKVSFLPVRARIQDLWLVDLKPSAFYALPWRSSQGTVLYPVSSGQEEVKR